MQATKIAFCPVCKETHEFIPTGPSSYPWMCSNGGGAFSNEDLTKAFLNISKDKSYKTTPSTHNKGNITTTPLLTLPIDSEIRKGFPLFSGCLRYFAAALAQVAKTSKSGNDKHNPGQPMHHARGKSMDHGDCIIRHLMDLEDMLAANKRAVSEPPPFTNEQILSEAGSLCWRALALSQELHERLGAAPMAPGARK